MKNLITLFILFISMNAFSQSKLDVTNYNATANDGTSDHYAIQNLINNTAQPGDTIYFPVGVYIIDTPLICTKKRLVFYGDGNATSDTTLATNTASTTTAKAILRASNNIKDWYGYTVKRIGILNLGTDSLTVNNICIDQNFRNSGKVDGNSASIAGIIIGIQSIQPGTLRVNTNQITIRSSMVYDYYGDAIDAHAVTCDNFNAIKNTCISAFIAGRWCNAGTVGEQGISINSGTNILIDSNSIYGGLDATIATHAVCNNVKITNNYITITGGALQVQGTHNGLIKNNTIVYITKGQFGMQLGITDNDNSQSYQMNNHDTITENTFDLGSWNVVYFIRLAGPGKNLIISNNNYNRAVCSRYAMRLVAADLVDSGHNCLDCDTLVYNDTLFFGDSIILQNNGSHTLQRTKYYCQKIAPLKTPLYIDSSGMSTPSPAYSAPCNYTSTGCGTGLRKSGNSSSSSYMKASGDTDWRIYPNPASSYFVIDIGQYKTKDMFVELMDASGRVISKRYYTDVTRNRLIQYDVSTLRDGIYFVRINTENENKLFKLVKKE